MTKNPEIMATAQTVGTASSSPLWSVHAILGCLVFACLVPGLVGTALLFFDEYRGGHDRLEKDTILTARALVQTVDGYLREAQVAAQSLSTAGSLSKGDFADFHRRARDLLNVARLGSNFAVTDKTGQQVINTFREFGQPLPRNRDPASLHRIPAASSRPI